MPGYMIRPKSSTKKSATGMTYVEEIVPVATEDNLFTDGTNVTPQNRKPAGNAIEAPPGYPSSPANRGPVSKNVPSGFGRGTRAGNRSGKR